MNELTRQAMAHIKGDYPPICEIPCTPPSPVYAALQETLAQAQAYAMKMCGVAPEMMEGTATWKRERDQRRAGHEVLQAAANRMTADRMAEPERTLRWRDCRIAAQQQVIAERDAEIARLLAQNAMLLANPFVRVDPGDGTLYRWGVDMATGTAQWVATGTKTDQPRDQSQRYDYTPLRDAQGSRAYDRCHGFGDPDPTPLAAAVIPASKPPLPGRALNAGTVKTGLFVP